MSKNLVVEENGDKRNRDDDRDDRTESICLKAIKRKAVNRYVVIIELLLRKMLLREIICIV